MSEHEDLARALERLAALNLEGAPEDAQKVLLRASTLLIRHSPVDQMWTDFGGGLYARRVPGATLYSERGSLCWTVHDAPHAPVAPLSREQPAPLDWSSLPGNPVAWEEFACRNWRQSNTAPLVQPHWSRQYPLPVTVIVIPRTVTK